MREIKLHDTLSGEVMPLRPRDPGKVGIYACGPTVYSRIHIGNARPFVVFSLLKRFLEHEGYDTTLVINVTDVNDKIYDAARPQGRPERRAGGGDDRALHVRHRRSGPGPPRSRAARVGDDRADRRLHPDTDRQGPRLRGGRRRVLPRALGPRLRHAVAPPAREPRPGRGGGGRRAQGGPAGLRAVEGAQAGRGHELAGALGRGPAGLAHRVLGDGRAVPGRRIRHSRRRLRSGVPPPRERGRADARRARARSSRDCGCTTA